ncbi:MAG: zinc ribbon domain-containing protein, partial [Armatimonadetes bacterium]|nr:zinc ribbon domain-containing protein [Armatimonadota bacterium]
MICPKCGKEMTKVEKFWFCGECGMSVPIEHSPAFRELDPNHPFAPLIDQLPTPVAFALWEYAIETNPYIALHRLCDSSEIITRFLTIVALSDLLRQFGQFPERVRDALTEKIERPTFGAWKELLQVACDCLESCFIAELPEFVQKKWLPALGSGSEKPEDSIIALRNFIVHSARLPKDQAQKLLDAHKGKFESLAKELKFLVAYPLVACSKEGKVFLLKGLPANGVFSEFGSQPKFKPEPERVYLLKGKEYLDLFPLHAFTEILQLREERVEKIDETAPQVYFRLSERGFLEFVALSERAAFSQLRGSVYERFREIFRLEEWRRQRQAELEAKGLLSEVEE